MPESLEKLNLLLLTTKKSRIVQRDGIRLENLRYFHLNLVAYIGESITIRYDPNDLTEIWVYDEQNKCICKAVCEEFQDQCITYEELKKIRTNRKKDLKKEINYKVKKAHQLINKIDAPKNNKDKKTKLNFKLYENE
jgi:putative transposase